MPIAMLLMLQAVAIAGPSNAEGDTGAVSLRQPVPSGGCAAQANAIVVCGRDGDHYRLPKDAAPYETGGLPKAEWKILGKATGGIGFSQRNVGGYSSNAVMATIKLPF